MADGAFSLPITYRLGARGLEQVTTLTPAGATISTIVAPRVTGFVVSETGTRVSMTVTVTQTGRGRTTTRSRTIDVTPRN